MNFDPPIPLRSFQWEVSLVHVNAGDGASALSLYIKITLNTKHCTMFRHPNPGLRRALAHKAGPDWIVAEDMWCVVKLIGTFAS